MADLKQVEAAFLKADAAGDTDAARVLAGEVRRLRAEASGAPAQQSEPAEAKAPSQAPSFLDRAGDIAKNALSGVHPLIGLGARGAKNLAAGGVRGAGSIGATLLDAANKPGGALHMIGLGDKESINRGDMDAALTAAGADPNSPYYRGAKLGAEVAGTAGVGGALAQAAGSVPAIAARAPGLVNAVRTSGMTAGQGGAVQNAITRAAGGAITGGASAGLVNPSDAGAGAVVGGAAPGLFQLLGAGGRAVGGAVRGVTEPFRETGRQAIAGRTMQRFGITPDDVNGLGMGPTLTGTQTTLAEQITRPEGAAAAARLQDSIRTLDPQIAASMAAREVENNGIRVARLRDLAGEGGARDFAVANRAGTAGPMYDDAFRADLAAANIPERELRTLMRTPALREAAAAARTNAANAGANVGPANASGSVEGLHQMNLALDDMISKAEAKSTGAAANTAEGLRAAQRRLVSFIETYSPEYATARRVYADMSRPVNQMDIAAETLRRGSSATTDLAGNPRLMPDAMARALRDEPRLMQQATGRDLGQNLGDVLDPQQLNQLRAVAGEVDRAAAVARAGNGPGSATAQRLASTNLLQQMGVPESVTQNALVQTIMRPVQFGAQLAEPRIQQALLEIIQDPSLAAEAMRRATPAQRVQLQRLISAGQSAYRAAPVAAGDR